MAKNLAGEISWRWLPLIAILRASSAALNLPIDPSRKQRMLEPA